MSDTLNALHRNRADLAASARRMLDTATTQNRSLTPAESSEHDAMLSDLEQYGARISEVEVRERREAVEAQTTRSVGDPLEQRGPRSPATIGYEPGTYRQDSRDVSFFKDLASVRRGDQDAARRLGAHQTEQRALGNTSATGGSGGEFAAPAWLLEQFVALARGGRVIANRVTRQELPSGVSSINVPKVLTGTAVTPQSTQNTAVAQVDMTTGSLTSSIVAVAGKQVVSQQLLDQSGVAFDQIILGDLAGAYAVQLDTLVINSTLAGFTGILNVGGVQQVPYTSTTPAVAGAGGYYATLQKAVSAVSTLRFLPPDTIAMHPRRWSWIAASFDGQNRPLVVPAGGGVNSVGTAADVAASGVVGEIAGLAVITDPNLPVTLGTGTNQDPTLVMRAADLYLWESPLTFASFDAPYSDSMGVLLRVHGYSSFQGGRYPASVAVVNGTGTVTPAY